MTFHLRSKEEHFLGKTSSTNVTLLILTQTCHEIIFILVLNLMSVHHQEIRHHYVIHSKGTTKHVVLKEHNQETFHRHHNTVRSHHSTKEVENKCPEVIKRTRSQSASGPQKSSNFQPRRTVSEGSDYYRKYTGPDEVHHFHHHHHYHGGKEQMFKPHLSKTEKQKEDNNSKDSMLFDCESHSKNPIFLLAKILSALKIQKIKSDQ